MGVHALFLDFRKAFDVLDRGILLRELAELYINKNFWLWIQSLLDGRSQQVKLNYRHALLVFHRVPSSHQGFLMGM